MRIEITNRASVPDGRALRLLESLRRDASEGIADLRIVDVFLLHGVPPLTEEEKIEVFCDPVAQRMLTDAPFVDGGLLPDWSFLVEVTSKPGVADPVAFTVRDALRQTLGADRFPAGAVAQTAMQYVVRADPVRDADLAVREEDLAVRDADLAVRVVSCLHNPLIQAARVLTRRQWDAGGRLPSLYPHTVPASPARVERFDLPAMDDGTLTRLSRSRLLALSPAEMKAVQAYYASPAVRAERARRGLPPEATDVELEMIGQTWSEHCKHKIFNARILYREGGREERIDSLFRTCIRAVTEEVAGKRDYLRSVFHDNSGVVQFDEETLLCFKAETHNSPSALDPYGGAITGIVGVNRDIMGTGQGARPIFNTDFLCFGFPDTPAAGVPEGLLAPRRVLSGVHRGIVDGGNQSGIPTVAGGFLFDDSYLGKPLVFCGTGGILPAKVLGRDGWTKSVLPGDRAVMTGGRIGKDGIHGATFSSEALSEASPTSAVQIGDPITQKKMMDFLLEARDLGLYRGITDNGAGGLSSSLGEMAEECGGIRIELSACPLKYAGLAPWEILVSESQERMSLAVAPERMDAFLELARRRDVEATVVGEFTDSGRVEILHGGAVVGLLDLGFLHSGLPVMELVAEWPDAAPDATAAAAPAPVADLPGILLAILSDPNVRSREEWVRQYDHEVQGRSVVKPFAGKGRDAPSDGAVLRVRPDSVRGLTVTHGICPRYGDEDTYHMAQCAVDEAVRAHVALGGDPQRMAALDNFCWPDPVESPDTPDGRYKLAQLVRACRGLRDACLAYLLPLISGKDSMKNDARIGNRKVSVRPTLLVSLMGFIPDVREALRTDFRGAGDLIYLVGATRRELSGSIYERVRGLRFRGCPTLAPREAMDSYGKIHRASREGLIASCHDLSDGGLWAALAESCIGGSLGARVDAAAAPADLTLAGDAEALLFSETPSRMLVSVRPRDAAAWEAVMAGSACSRIGAVTGDGTISVSLAGAPLAAVGLEAARGAWKAGW